MKQLFVFNNSLCLFYGLCVVLFLSSLQSLAQPFSIDWLFQAGMRLSVGVVPRLSEDTTQLGIYQGQIGLILPLGGKAKISLQELDISGHQSFLNIVAGQRHIQSSLATEDVVINNFNLGFTHLKASIRNGIWLYTGNFGGLHTQGVGNFTPFGVAVIAKIQVRGLRKQNILGGGLAYFNNRILPVPVLGFNRKMSKKWDFRLLFPINITFSYKYNRKNTFDFRLNSQVFQTRVDFYDNRTQNLIEERWQYRQIQINSIWRYRIQKGWSLLTEIGVGGARRLVIENNPLRGNQLLAPVPYINISTYFDLGKQLLGAQMFATE